MSISKSQGPLKGVALGPRQVICVILFVRMLSVFLVQTWYEADEYWQTLEVAHKYVFGYGALTWEWQRGLRSYLYMSVVAMLYIFLKFTGLDSPQAVILVPRILQAVISTVADYRFYKWTRGRHWALFLILTSWYWFFTSGRTLWQTNEMALVVIALSLFPFKSGRQSYYEKESCIWIWLACICVYTRPTSAPLWIVLGVYNMLTTNQERLRLIMGTYVPVGLSSVGALVALDSFFYGSLVITPWNFFKLNIIYDIASFYGTHPWHWYLSQGLPAILGINLLPVMWSIMTILRRPSDNKIGLLLLTAIVLHVALHSFIPHKEFRYMLPLLPIFLYLAQDVIVPWSRKAKRLHLHIVVAIILLGNLVPALYFGLVHQRGTLNVMPLLRDEISKNRSSVLFLMPCHATPLYSHLHVNVSTRYLHCENPLDKPDQTPETEAFFSNPQHWWKEEYATRDLPDLIVLFDVLKKRVEDLLTGYRELYELPHTQLPEGEVGKKVLMYRKDSY